MFASSAEISVVVASFSVVVALMTARAVVLYDFPGKQLIYFLTILPFMIPVTVLAMGLQVLFINWGVNNTSDRCDTDSSDRVTSICSPAVNRRNAGCR